MGNYKAKVLGLVLALALIAAACGGDDDAAPTTTVAPTTTAAQTTTTAAAAPTTAAQTTTTAAATTTTAAPTTTEAPMMMVSDECQIGAPESGVTINMIGWTFDIMEFYAGELEKCNGENVEVNTQLLQYQDARDQMLLDLTSGGTSAYEIVHGANGEISEFGSQGLVVRLNDLVEKYWDEYDLGDISQIAWDGATFEEGIYGIPVVSNTQHLMYRPDLYEKYGLSVPANYDEVINSCNVMRDESSIDLPFVMNLHAGSAWDVWFLHFFRGFGGGNYLNPDNTPAVNSPEGVAAVAKIKEVIDACMGAQGLTYDYNAVQLGLQTGGLASSTLWASRAAAMDDPDESLFVNGIEFAVAPSPMPGGPAGSSAWNDFLMIPASADVDAELIFKIIMEATDAESQLGAAEVGIPTRASATGAGVGGRYLSAAAESVANGIGIFAPNPAVRLMRNALGNQLPLVGTGEKTPQQALEDAVEEYLVEARAQDFVS